MQFYFFLCRDSTMFFFLFFFFSSINKTGQKRNPQMSSSGYHILSPIDGTKWTYINTNIASKNGQ